jgi:hypothetical protein
VGAQGNGTPTAATPPGDPRLVARITVHSRAIRHSGQELPEKIVLDIKHKSVHYGP